MIAWANILLQPLAHGAVGWWDEILNLLPLLAGTGLLLFLYIQEARRRR